MLLKLVNVSKTYNQSKANEVQALQNVSLEILSSEFLAIVGPSGSGKSTLLNILGCLDRPTKGDYFFEDKKINGISEKEMAVIRNNNMGFIFQTFQLIPEDTILENVMLPLMYRSGSRMEKMQKALEIIDKIQLLPRKNHKTTELSGGEMQRVAIARALVKKPKIIFADEPTGNLDYKSKIDIIKLIQQLNKDEKITILLVTHDQMLMRYATRKITLEAGRLIHF